MAKNCGLLLTEALELIEEIEELVPTGASKSETSLLRKCAPLKDI